ncbi:hypothetical protein NBRC116601_03090 [Cognatishimia sp. WU-CL00825]
MVTGFHFENSIAANLSAIYPCKFMHETQDPVGFSSSIMVFVFALAEFEAGSGFTQFAKGVAQMQPQLRPRKTIDLRCRAVGWGNAKMPLDFMQSCVFFGGVTAIRQDDFP